MDRKVKLLVGGVGILVLLSILVMTTMSSSAEFVTPTELSESDDYDEELVKLEGRAVSLEDDEVLTFDVIDENHTTAASYDGEMPETMSDGRIVVAEGHYDGNELEASDLTVRAHEGEHPDGNESNHSAHPDVDGFEGDTLYETNESETEYDENSSG
ncbi:cytochrome c maturation protein CcmE [Natronolimnobius sp. AArcel1]|uniref:cytochrome c maturation protein CcmE domain-containing protein n=1 Tax=Natronolimnobius sp. AArcel1 TaxID=1679093 RepID=UPI0013EB6711|nr:cytochrome c maturation protein CcmE [Natronolimnobius sp. AArcel1]NGM70691.1 cytochrome c maturation protein CcmE [Natronolimnobius sp. AArcel1]